MDFQTRNQLLALLPTEVHHLAVIAGGYVADARKADDIDVWILGATNLERQGEALLKRIQEAFKAQLVQYRPQTDAERDLLMEGTSDGRSGGLDDDEFQVLATYIIAGVDKPIQVLLTTHKTPGDLLRAFDISTHQIAQQLDSLFVTTLPTTTGTDEQPRLVDITRPASSLRRLERLCERYGFAPLVEDVVRLRRAIQSSLDSGVSSNWWEEAA